MRQNIEKLIDKIATNVYALANTQGDDFEQEWWDFFCKVYSGKATDADNMHKIVVLSVGRSFGDQAVGDTKVSQDWQTDGWVAERQQQL